MLERVSELRDLLARPAAVLALAERVCPTLNGNSSYRLAAALETVDTGVDPDGSPGVEAILEAAADLDPAVTERWQDVLDRLDARVVSVLDDEYPLNLRMVQDHPPFLFVRGTLEEGDERAMAVVGTRTPSDEGRKIAYEIAGELASRGVTVVSGLAAGIDTAAHAGALAAGGRTLAVFGTGITNVYPAANRALAKAVTGSGAVVSQFWPDAAPARWTFPVRNIVTSGLSLGTVVVEASQTSGAMHQAHRALAHGKRLFLMRRLVEEQSWARDLMGTPGVTDVDDVETIVSAIEADLEVPAVIRV